MLIMKFICKICPGAVVLSHDHICHIAVTPLPGKIIASLLHLHIHDASVGKLYDDVHHDKGAFLREMDSLSWQYLFDFDGIPKVLRQKTFQSFRMLFGIENVLEKRVVYDLQPPFSTQEIENLFLIGKRHIEKFLVSSVIPSNLPKNLILCFWFSHDRFKCNWFLCSSGFYFVHK